MVLKNGEPHLQGAKLKFSRPLPFNLGKASQMIGVDILVLPSLWHNIGSPTRTEALGNVRRAASNWLHTSNTALLAPERSIPSFAIGSALNSTCTFVRPPLSIFLSIVVIERRLRRNSRSMADSKSVPSRREIPIANEDRLVNCVISCSTCSKRYFRF